MKQKGDQMDDDEINETMACDMTMRERFVMAAMQGLCANSDMFNDIIETYAVEIADRTIAEMERTKK